MSLWPWSIADEAISLPGELPLLAVKFASPAHEAIMLCIVFPVTLGAVKITNIPSVLSSEPPVTDQMVAYLVISVVRDFRIMVNVIFCPSPPTGQCQVRCPWAARGWRL